MGLCGPPRCGCAIRSDSLFITSGAGVFDIETYEGVATESPDTRPTGANRFLGMRILTTDTGRLWWWNGSAWVLLAGPSFTNYTPVLSGAGWAIGAGTATGRYTNVNGMIHMNASIVFGAGATFGAAQPAISLPVNAATSVLGTGSIRPPNMSSVLTDSGSAVHTGNVALGTTTAQPLYLTTSATSATDAAVSSTAPFTWVATDQMAVGGWYEAA